MKKFLLMLAMLLPCVGAWAQTVVTAINTGKYYTLECRSGSAHSTARFIGVTDDGKINGQSATAAFITFEAASSENGYYIKVADKFLNHSGSNISASTEKQTVWTLGVGGKDNVANVITFTIGNDKYLNNNGGDCNDGTCSNLKANSHSGGPGSGNACSLWQLVEYDSPEFPTYITEINQFENGKLYTFVTARGWMGAKDGSANIISTAKAAHGLTGNKTDANFQWTVYKSENNNYYLYNVGKQMFMGVQSTNNASVPFAETPQGKTLSFKKSGSNTYPIMLSTDNAGVVNHSTSYGDGLITWTGGWTNLNDDGSNHQVMLVGDLDETTLDKIEAIVAAYELDNTEAKNALGQAIAKAQTMFETLVGTGLGKYSATDADYETKFNAIVEFYNNIQSTNNPTPAEVEAKTAEVNEIIASFTLNMPESGKFYRFSHNYGGVVGNLYVQAVACGVQNKANGMLMSSDQDEKSIFYYADNKLLSYSEGLYVNDKGGARGLQAVGVAGGDARFVAGTAVGLYGIFAGDSFHANTSGDVRFIDHCGSVHNDSHNFTVEEVTSLPVTISAAKYATFYAPVAVEVPAGVTAHTVTINGEWATLSEALEVIPSNTGVVLYAKDITEETTYYFAITEDVEAIEGNALRGTAATTYFTEAGTYYALANKDGEVRFYKDSFSNDRFQNNSHKAYLYVPNTSAASAFKFRFEDGTTAIESILNNGADANAPIYDLSGRRVMNAVKGGIYIQNGKKFIVK